MVTPVPTFGGASSTAGTRTPVSLRLVNPQRLHHLADYRFV